MRSDGAVAHAHASALPPWVSMTAPVTTPSEGSVH